MQHNYVHGTNGGNAVKSRAQRNEIYFNWIEGALYHELELIGPDPAGGNAIPGVREDSDVVGNVLRKTNTFSVTRFGGDGTGASEGRYRFAFNTVITQPGGGAVFRLFDPLESVEMHGNVFYGAGGAAVNMLREVEADWVAGPRRGRQPQLGHERLAERPAGVDRHDHRRPTRASRTSPRSTCGPAAARPDPRRGPVRHQQPAGPPVPVAALPARAHPAPACPGRARDGRGPRGRRPARRRRLRVPGWPRPATSVPKSATRLSVRSDARVPRVHQPEPPARTAARVRLVQPAAARSSRTSTDRLRRSVGSIRYKVGDRRRGRDGVADRCAAAEPALADYTGELSVEQLVQITDRFNGPSQTEPATTQASPFGFARAMCRRRPRRQWARPAR